MRALRVVKMIAVVLVACVVLGLVVEHLWNWLMPALFGLHLITYWQSVGLLLLSKILLGGFHRHVGGGRHWRGRMQEKWAEMSPEEREKFRAGMKARFCGMGRGGRHGGRGGWQQESNEDVHERQPERG